MWASQWWSPVLQEEAIKICLASDSSDIRAMWTNRERVVGLKRWGNFYFSAPFIPLLSLFLPALCHLFPFPSPPPIDLGPLNTATVFRGHCKLYQWGLG